jgi:hypothetical protein
MHENRVNLRRNSRTCFLFGKQGHFVADCPKEMDAKDNYCRTDLPGPTTSVGTRTDYSVGPWDYPTCAARHLMA